MVADLTDSELLAFCGLVRYLVRLDGQISEQERVAIAQVGPTSGGPEMVKLPNGECIDSTEVTRLQYKLWLDTIPSTGGQLPECEWNSTFLPITHVWEWVNSCDGHTGKDDKCRARGGAFYDDDHVLRCDNGGGMPPREISYGIIDGVGIRCCRTAD